MGKLAPPDYDLKECWNWRPPGEKPWVIRALYECLSWIRKPKGQSSALPLTSVGASTSSDQQQSVVASTVTAEPKMVSRGSFREVFY